MATVKIEEVKPQVERFAAHSHIRGLGVRNGKVEFIADGFVGQVEAREAAYIIHTTHIYREYLELLLNYVQETKKRLFACQPKLRNSSLNLASRKAT